MPSLFLSLSSSLCAHLLRGHGLRCQQVKPIRLRYFGRSFCFVLPRPRASLDLSRFCFLDRARKTKVAPIYFKSKLLLCYSPAPSPSRRPQLACVLCCWYVGYNLCYPRRLASSLRLVELSPENRTSRWSFSKLRQKKVSKSEGIEDGEAAEAALEDRERTALRSIPASLKRGKVANGRIRKESTPFFLTQDVGSSAGPNFKHEEELQVWKRA